MQTPPPHFWSAFYGWWGVCYIVCIMGNIIKKFSDFYVSSYRKLTIFRTKMTINDHNLKNKNWKNLKLGFSFYSADCSWIGWIKKKLDLIIQHQNTKKKFSKVVKLTWKNHNRLNKMKNQVSDFSNFLFFVLGSF